MLGIISDKDIDEAEIEFPGIRALYLGCGDKPRTFLELVARYLGMAPSYGANRSVVLLLTNRSETTTLGSEWRDRANSMPTRSSIGRCGSSGIAATTPPRSTIS